MIKGIFAKNPEKQTKFEGLANSVKRRQTQLDLERLQVAKAIGIYVGP